MRKILGVVLVILGIISLIGVISFAFPLLFEMASAASEMSDMNINGTSLQGYDQAIMVMVYLGVTWSIALLLSGIFNLYFGIQILRKKKI